MSTAPRSPCGQGQVEEAYLLYYLFDGNPFRQSNFKIITQKNIVPIPKMQSSRIFT
jgi:hypothetical protein